MSNNLHIDDLFQKAREESSDISFEQSSEFVKSIDKSATHSNIKMKKMISIWERYKKYYSNKHFFHMNSYRTKSLQGFGLFLLSALSEL